MLKVTGKWREHTSTWHRPALKVITGVADIVDFLCSVVGEMFTKLKLLVLSLELGGKREARRGAQIITCSLNHRTAPNAEIFRSGVLALDHDNNDRQQPIDCKEPISLHYPSSLLTSALGFLVFAKTAY